METKAYLDFDEAVQYLKTNSSTLYKWLQSGKVPGHKLGRQWRFLREELEIHVSGKSTTIQTQKDALEFSNLLSTRSQQNKEKKMTSTSQLAENLIWDAYDHGSNLIHIFPAKGKYEVSYRTPNELQKLTSFQEDFFVQLDDAFTKASSPLSDAYSRRMHLQRSDDESIQVKYQKVDTVTGPRLTLLLLQPHKEIHPFENIVASNEVVSETFKKWTKATHGIIVLAGLPGSGKTTTLFSFLNEFKKQNRVVFSIESQVHMVIDGIHQVEVTQAQPEKLRQTCDQIWASDPDVISFRLSSTTGLEKEIYTQAFNFANSGHIAILQLELPDAQAVAREMQKYISHEFQHLMIGVSVQRLEANDNGGKKAVYSLT